MRPMQYVLLFIAFATGCAGSVSISQLVEDKGSDPACTEPNGWSGEHSFEPRQVSED